MTRSIWTEASRIHWPRPTKGYWFLGQAVDLIGRYVFAEKWRIEDMQAYRIFPRPKPEFIEGSSGGRSLNPGSQRPPSREDRIKAHADLCRKIDGENAAAMAHNQAAAASLARRYHVQGIVQASATDGQLSSFYRSNADLTDQPIPEAYWATMWSPAIFEAGSLDGSAPSTGWMRPVDRGREADVFFIEAEVRAIDWKRVERRSEPAPLGEPEPLSAVNLPPVSERALRDWVAGRRAAGVSQERMAEEAKTAFPGHEAPSGNSVRRIDRELGRCIGRPRKKPTAKSRSE